MMRRYRYVGPPAIRSQADAGIPRLQLQRHHRLRDLREALELDAGRDPLVLTFVVDAEGRLWVSDRRAEHVACARGEDVLAAGELTLAENPGLQVMAASNQSTGYCPEPASWQALAAALRSAGIPHPTGFEHAFQFRRCVRCRAIVLIKDDVYECTECAAPLPETWNF